MYCGIARLLYLHGVALQSAAHLLQLILCLAERIPEATDLRLALQQLLLALLLRLLQVVLHAYGALHLP